MIQGKRTKNEYRLLSLFILLVSLLVLSPLLLAFMNSFKSYAEISTNVGRLPEKIHLENYANAWKQLDFVQALYNSLFITVVSNVGVVLIASMAAFRMSRFATRFHKVLYALILSDMILPFQVVMIPLTIVLKRLGLINSLWGVIYAYLGMGIPMALFTYSGFLKSFPKDLQEAAQIDGCGEIRMFFGIVFPLLKPTTFTLFVINTFWFWNDYLLPLLVLSAKNKRTIPIAIDSLMGEYVMQWDLALPALTMAVIPALIAFLLLQRHIVAGLTAGAVKA